MLNVVNICKATLARLSKLDYELTDNNSSEQLIFPTKTQAKGNVIRISEQELRLLFIEELKKEKDISYSIETPTERKYKFGDSYEEIECNDINGQSALVDLCVFKYKDKKYHRLLNIEFKHKNTGMKNIAKDIVKLIFEKHDGAFIHLLNNTDMNTLCNNKSTGVFDKLCKAFCDFNKSWNNDNKCILIVILSLREKKLIYREICKQDLCNIKQIFFSGSNCGNIKEVNGMGWKNT